MLYFFALNGPPSSGKSTFANVALKEFQTNGIKANPESLAAPIKSFMSALLGQPYSTIAKDERLDDLLRGTPRQFLIDLAEKFIKLYYGRDFFAKALLYRWRDCLEQQVLVIDDIGFPEELSVLPETQKFLIRVLRPKCNFSSDSRSYLSPFDGKIINDGDLNKGINQTVEQVNRAIKRWNLK